MPSERQGDHRGDTSYTHKTVSPRKEEWALINDHKAMEFQKLKKIEQMLQQQKKIKFKQELDKQVQKKQGSDYRQKQQDKMYAEYVGKKAEEQKNRVDNEKFQKYIERRKVEAENQQNLNFMYQSKSKERDYDTGYHLDIGQESERKRNYDRDLKKNRMIDELDKQVQIKNQLKHDQKINSLQKDQQNLQFQFQYFDNRKLNHRSYGQNPYVYQQYSNLVEENKRKDEDLDFRLVYEAGERKQEEERMRIQEKERIKHELQYQMKETLDEQVKINNYKKQQEHRFNPEEVSYGVIQNMFKPRNLSYDKKEYSEYLRRQAEEQKKRKEYSKYMTEEEYRLNLNQLNRAVDGRYANETYIDRSLGVIGDNKKLNSGLIEDHLNDENSEIVKRKLEEIKMLSQQRAHQSRVNQQSDRKKNESVYF